MTIHLPEELESSVRAEVLRGHFASEEDFVTEAVREYLNRRQPHRRDAQPVPDQTASSLGSIGAMRDAAEELDEIVADAMKRRQPETWRDISVE